MISVRVAELRQGCRCCNKKYESLAAWIKGNPNHVYVGRIVCHVEGSFDSPFRNQFVVGGSSTLSDVLRKYKDWLRLQPRLMERARVELKGKTLGCWCRDAKRARDPEQFCHADILAEMANEDRSFDTQETKAKA